jgi:hypothetical protein
MKNKNFVLEESSIEEGGAKVYGFTKFAIAREKLIATLKAKEFNGIEFEAAFNELSQEVKNIEDMYKLLATKVGSNYDIMPTNVENSRNRFIPRRFKKNITHNAQINSLYLTFIIPTFQYRCYVYNYRYYEVILFYFKCLTA